MEFNGEIVFDIADENSIEVDFGTDMLPTKTINKGDVIALGKKAPKYRWIYQVNYDGEIEYFEHLESLIDLFIKRVTTLVS